MDAEIENRVKSCHACQENLNSPAKAPVHSWVWPERAWSRVHIDYAGPFEGSMFLIVIDAYSKWMEVIPVCHAHHRLPSTSSESCLQPMASLKC